MARWQQSRRWQQLTAPLKRNVGAKLFAAGAAFTLWLFVNAGERETLVLQYPVELRNLPENTVLVGDTRLDSVAVRLNGPGLLLASLDTRRAPIVIDLSQVAIGEATRIKIRDEMVRLPRGVRVLDVEPGRVPVHLEEVRTVTVPVRLVRGSEPAEDFAVESLKVQPERVTVAGPPSGLQGVREVETEPIDLATLTASTRRMVPLVRPEGALTVRPERVAVAVTLRPILASRQLADVPVDVVNVEPPFQLRPSRVNLTLRGPKATVRTLTLTDGSVFVDGEGLGPGTHTVTVEATLPPGVELVERTPRTLRLEIPKPENGAGQ